MVIGGDATQTSEGMEERGPSPRTYSLRGKEWYYKGEGNANVVLAVPDDGTILRVMKDTGEGTTAAETLSTRTNYCEAVKRLFLGRHADAPTTVSVSGDELREIDRLVRHRRPVDRLHKGLRWADCLAAVCPDYTVLPGRSGATVVHCAEIKPKQGWTHGADAVPSARGGPCPFCAHQYLKLGRGDVRSRSQYCPLDLFSGRRRRVERAVRSLLRSPQNNLKTFRNGLPSQPVDGETFGFGDVDRFCAFVAAALLGDFDGAERSVTLDRRHDETSAVLPAEGKETRPSCDPDAIPMPGHCVLHQILAMQKMQTIGFAEVCAEYDRMLRRESAPPQFDHVGRIVTAAETGRVAALSPVDGYLVAATARDCSVFVTFCRSDDGGQPDAFQFGEHYYAVRVKVSDLDPKPLSTVDKHRKRNAEVSAARELYSSPN